MASTYTLDEVLYEDDEAALYRAHADDGHPVLAKTLKAAHPTSAEIEGLRRELDAGRRIGTDAVARPEALATIEGRAALVLQDDGVVSLAKLLGRPSGLDAFFRIALALTDAVATIHETHALHGRLHPAEILVRTDDRVELIGLGRAQVPSALPDGASAVPAAMWPYLSPEQTWHLGIPVDHRSDLYALGAIFFEVLTGRRPFEARAFVGWRHAHCAVVPPPPSERAPGIPAVVDAIVRKLLSKAPEARYQSAAGLREDLARAAESWRAHGFVEPFAVGHADVPPPLRFAARTYGRNDDLRLLEQAIERVAKRKQMEVVLIGGASGIGKTSLLEELRRTTCVRARAIVGIGRCAGTVDAPCGALFEALDGVLASTLDSSEEPPTELRSVLESMLGPDVALLSALVPSLARVVPVTPRELGGGAPAEADHRVAAAIDHFLCAFANGGRTIVLLLDDVQHADFATTEHLFRWANGQQDWPLLVIGTYREDEAGGVRPIDSATERLGKAGVSVVNTSVGPLGRRDVTAWLADVLQRRPEEVGTLAEAITERSGGVPLVITRQLESLYRRGHIRYSVERRRWEWDLAAVRAEPYTDDAAALIAQTIEQLPSSTREALSLFAAHGRRADLATLAIVLACAPGEVLARLEPAFTRRLVARVDGAIAFLHERIQSVAYDELGDRRAEVHLRIARSFLARFPTTGIGDRVFEIVRHVHLADRAAWTAEERTRIAELALLAGRRALETGQPSAAIDDLAHAVELLDETSWSTRHDLAFALRFSLAQARALAGEVSEAEALAISLLTHATTPPDRAAVHGLLADLAFARGAMPEARRACLDGLEALGIEIPEHPTDEEADAATSRALAHLAARAQPLSELPAATDAAVRAASDLFAALIAPGAYTDWNLVWVAAARSAEWSLTHGKTSSSSTGYAVLALRLAHRGAYAEAFRLGEEAYRLARGDENAVASARTAFLFLAFLSFMSLSVHDAITMLHRELAAARSSGDLTHASYLQRTAVHFRFFAGDGLAHLAAAAREDLAFAERTGHVAVVRELESMVWLLDRLTGESREAPFVSAHEHETLPLATLVHHYHEVVARYLFGDAAGAVDAAEDAKRRANGVVGGLEAIDLHFFAALAHAADTRDRAGALDRIRPHHDVVDALAQASPANFGARNALLHAEVHRLAGRELDAESCYETAIRAARSSASIPMEAIASECAARFYRAREMPTAAHAYLAQAYECYVAWGADAKARALVEESPSLRATESAEPPDVQTLLEAQRAISSTYDLSALQARLLAVAIEHAGAERGCLLVPSDHDLILAGAAGSRAADFGEPDAPIVSSRVPLSLCRTAMRLRKPIVLSDATEATRYAVDPYLARGTTRSVLCLPIVRARQATALLYLENDLVPGVFSRARLVVLDSIAAQAAITLDTARLISRLESENADRRRAEEKLADHRRLLEDILDATPAVVSVKDAEGRYLLVNRRFEQVFHVDRHAFHGLTDRDLFPDDKVEQLRAWDRLALGGRTLELDHTLSLDDGEHAFMTIAFPLFDASGSARAVCAVATDVTARKRAEEELRRSLSLVEAAIESTADGTLVVDRGGTIVRYNRRFAEMWSVPEEDLRSGEDARVLRSVAAQLADPSGFLERVHELYATPDATSDDTLLLADGRVFERRSQPQRIGAEVVGRVWSFRDVTPRVRAVEERDRLLAKETRARAEAEEAVRMRDEFLSVASHELRTPLASLSLAIDGLQQIFAKREIDEASKRALGIAKRQVGRLTALIGLLLDVSRIRAGRLVLDTSEVDLRTIVRDVTRLLADEMARAGSDLVLEADEPVVGRWDGVRLEQVVHNLLGNAIKFGGGLPITVRVRRAGEVAELSVRDRGIGISPEFRRSLYEPFARGVSSRHYGGLGLGLFITRTIVEAHGGELHVESEEGVGSEFTVRLPLSGP